MLSVCKLVSLQCSGRFLNLFAVAFSSIFAQ